MAKHRVARTRGVGRQKPTCAFRVTTAVSPDRRDTACGRVGDFEIDGVVLCRNHAGQTALRILLESNHGA